MAGRGGSTGAGRAGTGGSGCSGPSIVSTGLVGDKIAAGSVPAKCACLVTVANSRANVLARAGIRWFGKYAVEPELKGLEPKWLRITVHGCHAIGLPGRVIAICRCVCRYITRGLTIALQLY